MSNDATGVARTVRAFYEEMPFNFYSSTERACRQLKVNAVACTYPDLHALLQSGQISTSLDFGCGAGWLVNTLAYHYQLRAKGVDMTEKALQRATEAAQALPAASASFVHSDIFHFEQPERVDLVTSMGVLHHTVDAKAAFEHIQQFVAPGKYLYLGLYHYYGRKVFLNLFRELIASQGEAAALEHYKAMEAPRLRDETHLESWFRDQVIHPHETQHTLREVAGWLAESGLTLQSTSINRFEPVADLEDLFELEELYEQRSHQVNVVEGRYFPGFFTVLAQRQ